MRLLLTVLMALYCSIFFGQNDLELRDSTDYVKVLNPQSPIDKEELKELIEFDKSVNKEMLNLNPNISFSGSLLIGYDYGFPMQLNENIGLNAGYSISGSNSLEFSRLPLLITYAYRQNAVNPGLENFFRIDFDSQKFKQQQEDLKKKKIKFNQDILDSLKGERVIDLKTLYALQVNKEQYSISKADLPENLDVPEIPIGDRLDYQDKFKLPSSSGKDFPALNDSIDSNLANALPNSLEFDTIRESSLNDSIAFINERLVQAEALMQKQSRYQSYLNHESFRNGKSSFRQDFSTQLSKFERFQIGQVVPSFTNVILAGFPMNGVGFKHVSKAKKETHFVHGQLININPVNDNARSTFVRSFFSDIVPSSQNIGDRITAFRRDLIKNDEIEMAITGLFGLDKYSNENKPYGVAILGRNAVYGLYLKRSTRNFGVFQLEFAQSNTIEVKPDLEDQDDLNKPIRGEVVSFSWEMNNPKKGLVLKNGFRLTTPNYHSLGNAFLRGNQIRNDFSLSKKVSKMIHLNLGSTYLLSNVFTPQLGLSELVLKRIGLQVRPTKHLALRGNYTYALNRVKSSNLDFKGNSWNLMLTANYTKRQKDTFYSSLLTMNVFRIQSDSLNEGLMEVRELVEVQLPNSKMISGELSALISTSADTKESAIIAGSGLKSPLGQRTLINVNGRMIFMNESRVKFGYGLSMETKVSESTSFILGAEKVIIDFFITEDLEKLYNEFPYRFSATYKYSF